MKRKNLSRRAFLKTAGATALGAAAWAVAGAAAETRKRSFDISFAMWSFLILPAWPS